jgi:predicted DNA-binding transcriptional regulator YafY
MSRAERLLDLIQALRRYRQPVSGQTLADELGVSIRTLYRDIATLQGQGAAIDGEAGLGYILRPGYMLPPLMFTEEEIEALVLGSRWVAKRSDARLGLAARNALAKITAVLPAELRDDADNSSLLVGPGEPLSAGENELPSIRQAIRNERKIAITYRDDRMRETKRTIWPFALGYFDRVRIVAAWCELRHSVRHFRADRIVALDVTETRYPRRRRELLKEWREAEGIAAP